MLPTPQVDEHSLNPALVQVNLSRDADDVLL